MKTERDRDSKMKQSAYTVEKFKAHMLKSNLPKFNKISMHVKWLGFDKPGFFPDGDDTLEPLEAMMEDVPLMVEKYFLDLGLKVEPHPRQNDLFALEKLTEAQKEEMLLRH